MKRLTYEFVGVDHYPLRVCINQFKPTVSALLAYVAAKDAPTLKGPVVDRALNETVFTNEIIREPWVHDFAHY